MGCSAESNLAGCVGPVAEPEPPVSPEVVGIDSDRQIPADRSIYVGEYANFNLVVFPVDYECVESDFSCDTAGVTLSLLEGYTNVLQIDVADTVTPGTEVNVFFRSQKIMHVTAVAQPEPVPTFTSCQGVGFESRELANTMAPTAIGAELTQIVEGEGQYYIRVNGANLNEPLTLEIENEGIAESNIDSQFDDHAYVYLRSNGYIQGIADMYINGTLVCQVG